MCAVSLGSAVLSLTGGSAALGRDIAPGVTSWVSSRDSGQAADSFGGTMSSDGRFVAFASEAADLVDGDTNDRVDIFLLDRHIGTVDLVSAGMSGEPANDGSGFVTFDNFGFGRTLISADGRFVVFSSMASNLVPDDTNDRTDVFVRDMQRRTTQLASVGRRGGSARGDTADGAISADGRYVVFSSGARLAKADTNHSRDVYVRDLRRGRTRLVSRNDEGDPGNDYSFGGSISADGRFVAFDSEASNLAARDTPFTTDVFVRDRLKGTTRRVSVSGTGRTPNGGSWAGSISANGRYVAYESSASNLVPADSNGERDAFVTDWRRWTTRRVSVSSTGQQAGQFSFAPILSADGRFVAFYSRAANLVDGDTNRRTDVFVRDQKRDLTWRISVSTIGEQGNGASRGASMSADGRYIVYDSRSSNLVPEGSPPGFDVFLHDSKPQ